MNYAPTSKRRAARVFVTRLEAAWRQVELRRCLLCQFDFPALVVSACPRCGRNVTRLSGRSQQTDEGRVFNKMLTRRFERIPTDRWYE